MIFVVQKVQESLLSLSSPWSWCSAPVSDAQTWTCVPLSCWPWEAVWVLLSPFGHSSCSSRTDARCPCSSPLPILPPNYSKADRAAPNPPCFLSGPRRVRCRAVQTATDPFAVCSLACGPAAASPSWEPFLTCHQTETMVCLSCVSPSLPQM